MDSNSETLVSGPSRLALLLREFHTLLAAASVALAGYVFAQGLLPQPDGAEWYALIRKFVGPAWPFFAAVALFLLYVTGAWLVEGFGLAEPRGWGGVAHALHWATEASPLVGLLTTFVSLLNALLTYSAAGPGQPETQAAFIHEFAIAFGSSIAGGVLALVAFTLHRTLPHE